MPTIQYTAQLDFTDNGTFETGWRIKQGDFGDCEIVFRVVNNGVNMYDASVAPEIVFRRADGASVISNMTPNDGTYKYAFVGNELAVPGLTLVDVKYTDSEGRISSASCRFTVVEDTLGYDPTGAHTYDNPVSELVEQATAASEVAIDSSYKAEGFAVGEQGGVPVSSDSPYYHNNAKYYGLKNAEDIQFYENNGFLSKNLLSGIENGAWTASTQSKTDLLSCARSSDLVKVEANTTYTMSLTALQGKIIRRYLSFYSGIGSNTLISNRNWEDANDSFTTPNGCKYVSVTFATSSGSDNNPEQYISNAQIVKGSMALSYMPYAPSNNELTKISAIGTDESGRTTASKAYAIGEHFYKDGKFCTAKTAIASGATFTLNTNYVEGDVASVLDGKFAVIELTTDASDANNAVQYPSGFTQNNCIPVSLLIKDGSDNWRSAEGALGASMRFFVTLMSGQINISAISSEYKGKDAKLTLMRLY